jgi:pyrroline-5-carboxylate reductase
MNKKIAILGGGKMGQAIAKRLIEKGIYEKKRLCITNSETKNNSLAVQDASVIILSVKPQISYGVFEEIKGKVGNALIISVMAGIAIDTIQKGLGQKKSVIRVMPNLAATLGESMSVWVKSKEVTGMQKENALRILESIGRQLELKSEAQIDKATAISGSGPAYFFCLTELLEKNAIDLGFTPREARVLAEQTLIGSAELVRSSGESATDLRDSVTSKGGTTEAALLRFQKENLQGAIHKGIVAAYKKAEKLGKRV